MRQRVSFSIALVAALALGLSACSPEQEDAASAQTPTEATEDRPEFLPDGRAAMYLTRDQRAHISGEMLNFLRGVRTINQAIVDGDRETIATTAAALGPPRGAHGPEHRAMMQSIPEEFHELGRPLRHQFEAISQAAADATMDDLQAQMAELMNKCVDCHTTYGSVRLDE